MSGGLARQHPQTVLLGLLGTAGGLAARCRSQSHWEMLGLSGRTWVGVQSVSPQNVLSLGLGFIRHRFLFGRVFRVFDLELLAPPKL